MFKKDFPYFSNNESVYLDNAATTQKPQIVIDAMSEYYTNYCANTHRSSYGNSNKATSMYEDTRKELKDFINAKSINEIIFTKGITEGINFIASSYAKKFETIIISSLEHHSNIVPWHVQGRVLGKDLEVVKYKENLDFDYEDFERILKKNKNAFVSITHISNAFGKIHDIKRITTLSHKYNAIILIDAAQSLAHFKIDVKDINCDFFLMSAHKTFGPTGLGAIYIKESLLKSISPYQTGGATIQEVSFEKSELLDSPFLFEAGTQNISGVIAFGKSLEYINYIGYKNIEKNEKELYIYLHNELKKIPDIILYNNEIDSIGSKSFNIKGIIHDDIGILLDKMKINIRVGHHCAQPIMKELGIKGTIRVSLSFYNDKEDINKFISALKRAIFMLRS
ncbi:MAG: cysteine desulfurase [Campylobacteraceae bacterium]|nr:cysteine desulfurase [Campylobacteraceae bacterium]